MESYSIGVITDHREWVFNGFARPSPGPLFTEETSVYLVRRNTVPGSTLGSRRAIMTFVPDPETKEVVTIICDDRNGNRDNVSVTVEGM